MLGAGKNEPKRQLTAQDAKPVDEWVTLDVLGEPDILFDLVGLHNSCTLPCKDEEFDEIHAYEVLEHIGWQGNWRGFFAEFKEYWRVLKPGGTMFISAPTPETLWQTDVGHTRCIASGILGPLTRHFYERNKETCATDYSELVDPHWWKLSSIPAVEGRQFFILVKE
jgi:predicted SAM-dependent methyltransferase